MKTYQTPAFLEFLDDHEGRGGIKIRTILEGGAVPIEGTFVGIYKIIDGVSYQIAEGYTDSCGIIEFTELPCLSKEFSLMPEMVPYAGVMYEVQMSHENFGTAYSQVAVFDGVKTIFEICPLNRFSQ